MKTIRFILIILIAFIPFISFADDASNLIAVLGVVKDANQRKALESVNVTLAGSHIGTVTNKDGYFVLKVPKGKFPITLAFTHLSYAPTKIEISDVAEAADKHVVLMRIIAAQIKEIVVTPVDAEDVVNTAYQKISKNYPDYPTMLSGFYRETIQKKKRYISVAEAVIKAYKPPYTKNPFRQNVQVLKGRKLISSKVSDTLSVKLMGGPLQIITFDYVVSQWPLLEPENLNWYKYYMEEYVMLDGRLHYKIRFEPRVMADVPLMNGYYYIDRETFSIDRIEASTDMKDEALVTQQMLKKKPRGMRFKPQELSCVVTYKTIDGKTYPSYIKNVIRFQCDWKRRLFHTNYTVISETVITDHENNPHEAIAYKNSFKDNDILPDRIEYFLDQDFWKDYNIIEPTESLDEAVAKLMKDYK